MGSRERHGGWDPPRRIVVLHDLSHRAGHAAWRAGMVARDHGAELCLLHARPDLRAAGKARPALERLAGELAGRFGLAPEVRIVAGEPLRALAETAAGLLVLPARRRTLLDGLLGTPAGRLLRLAGRPVLLVRRPALASYRRVLVPVDFEVPAASALAAAAALCRTTRIEVFHALCTREEVTMRAADVPEAQMRVHRRTNADRARAWLADLIGSVPGASRTAAPSIGFGDAAALVLLKEQAMRADLVVIGKRRRPWLADFLLGSVTQRVLADAAADVLALPAAQQAQPDGWLVGGPVAGGGGLSP